MTTPNAATLAYKATGFTGSRTLADRAADICNVLDLGCDNTGVSDCSVKINAYIASKGTSIGVIFFPRGTYLFTSALNFDSGTPSFILRGVGGDAFGGSRLIANMPDYIIRRVVDNPGAPSYTRVIEDLYIKNTNVSPGSTISLVAGTSVTSDGITITIICNTPHGITVGDTRQISLSAVGGADASTYNTIWGATATSTTVLTAPYTIRTLANGTNGSMAVTPGGAIAMQGSLRGIIQNCYIEGYYGIFAAQDALITILNNALAAPGGNRPTGSVGIYLSGEASVHDCDINYYDYGVVTWSTGCIAFEINSCRMEANNTACYIIGASYGKIHSTSFENNLRDGIFIYGSSFLEIGPVSIHGTGSVTGINFEGVTYTTFTNINAQGDFSDSCIKQQPNANFAGTSFRACVASNTGAGTQVSLSHMGVQISGGNFTETYTVAQRPLSSTPTIPIEGDVLMFSDVNAADAVWNGVVGATGPPGTSKAVARYSSNSNVWRVIGMWT